MRKNNFAILILVALGLTVAIASVITSKPVECECLNTTNTNSLDMCQNNVVRCVNIIPDQPSSCFVLWTTDNLTGELHVKMKGCFTGNACNNTECIDTSTTKQMNFCCCTGHMCNSKYRIIPTTTEPSKPLTRVENAPLPDEGNTYKHVVMVCGILVIVGVAIFFILYYKSKNKTSSNEITNDPDANPSDLKLTPYLPIILFECKASGRFGSVWRAQMKHNQVAVKVFQQQHEESWIIEQNIFNLPCMKHPNILEFIGVEKHLDRSEYWLITAYHPYGSLCDYLKVHTVTWTELCKIAESMACGLMHLHEEIPASESNELKPVIAHRDFKSKNILLKHDLTVCIADFGLALTLQPDNISGYTRPAGTHRYMAPEILEGAINFRRDAFLRIDIYAYALVLWEVVSRCTSHGGTVPDYTLPFEIEIGLHPTLEILQQHIVTNKNRPSISKYWREHSGLSKICNTIEECWDHDAEARLTASCVFERISFLNKNEASH